MRDYDFLQLNLCTKLSEFAESVKEMGISPLRVCRVGEGDWRPPLQMYLSLGSIWEEAMFSCIFVCDIYLAEAMVQT